MSDAEKPWKIVGPMPCTFNLTELERSPQLYVWSRHENYIEALFAFHGGDAVKKFGQMFPMPCMPEEVSRQREAHLRTMLSDSDIAAIGESRFQEALRWFHAHCFVTNLDDWREMA